MRRREGGRKGGRVHIEVTTKVGTDDGDTGVGV